MQPKRSEKANTRWRSESDGDLQRFTVVYALRGAPEDTRSETISAPNAEAAHQIAQRFFADADILRIRRVRAKKRLPEYPSARFIHGRFEPAAP